jgi:hypothetical protein
MYNAVQSRFDRDAQCAAETYRDVDC